MSKTKIVSFTLDDLHTEHLVELLEGADPESAAYNHGVDGFAWRRRMVADFDFRTVVRLRSALGVIKGKRHKIQHEALRTAVEEVALIFGLLLEKMASEDRAHGIEQFGPLKRTANEGLRMYDDPEAAGYADTDELISAEL